METEKNRNYQRIENKIVDAYKQHILEHTDIDMSITDLCKKAGINRTTFYKHYKKVEEVFFKLQDDFTEKHFNFNVAKSYKQFIKDPKKYIRNVAEQTLIDSKYVERLFNPRYVYRIMHQIQVNMFNEVKRCYPQAVKKFGESVVRTDICYFVGGCFAIVVSYIKHELPNMTTEHIVNQIGDALLLGYDQYK